MAGQQPETRTQEQLNQIRTTEAGALFQANQSGRNAIERVVGLFLWRTQSTTTSLDLR
jgi:hypothetical protein